MDKRRKTRIGFDTSRTAKNRSKENSYRNEEFAFEIDIPNDWSPYDYSLPVIPSLLFAIVHGWAPKVEPGVERLVEIEKKIDAAQQLTEPNLLIEVPVVACFGFAAFCFVGGVPAKPAGGLARCRCV